MLVCGVKFKDNGKTYFFKNNGLRLHLNQTVVVSTEKGEQFAKICDVNVKNLSNIDLDSMKEVIRVTNKKDYNNYLTNLKDADEALKFARELVDENHINMRIVDAMFTLDRKQLTFNFVADDRVDFRNIAKLIAAKYKTRIELHQIGVRDKAKQVSGLGPCGRPLCCSTFLTSIDTISINMAKNQSIALNPSKINGACGRLLCCLSYEDEVYACHRADLPRIGDVVSTEYGSGKVVSLDVLNRKYTVLIDGDKYEISK